MCWFVIGSFDFELVCGRSKGMKVNIVDFIYFLIVLDFYRGFLQVDIKIGDIQVLLYSFIGCYKIMVFRGNNVFNKRVIVSFIILMLFLINIFFILKFKM